MISMILEFGHVQKVCEIIRFTSDPSPAAVSLATNVIPSLVRRLRLFLVSNIFVILKLTSDRYSTSGQLFASSSPSVSSLFSFVLRNRRDRTVQPLNPGRDTLAGVASRNSQDS